MPASLGQAALFMNLHYTSGCDTNGPTQHRSYLQPGLENERRAVVCCSEADAMMEDVYRACATICSQYKLAL